MRYQDPKCTMTLRAALAELRAAEGDVSHEVSNDLAPALQAHDVVHVIFGLDTSELDEVVAHAWMLLGTTLTRSEVHAVAQNRDHKTMSRTLGHLRRVGLVARAIPRLVRAAMHARRMTKRWPWLGYHAHLDRPLIEIRHEFGIALDPRGPSSTNSVRGPHHGQIARSA